MRLVQLEYFLKIVECGSITRAAEELYISQPSLTKSISNLEKEYGIKLMERTPKGVTITLKGREFLEYAKDVINSKKALNNTFDTKSLQTPARRLCIASQQFDFLYPLLENLYRENGTAMNLILEEIDRGSIIEHVENHRVDLGVLVLSREDNRFFETSLRKKALSINELDHSSVYVGMSSRSPLYEKEEITTYDASKYLHVALDIDEELRRDMCLENFDSINKEHIIFCNTINACLYFMRTAQALLYIPKWATGLLKNEPDIRVAQLKMNDGKPWPMVNHLVWIQRENEELSILERRFVQLLSQQFR